MRRGETNPLPCVRVIATHSPARKCLKVGFRGEFGFAFFLMCVRRSATVLGSRFMRTIKDSSNFLPKGKVFRPSCFLQTDVSWPEEQK